MLSPLHNAFERFFQSFERKSQTAQTSGKEFHNLKTSFPTLRFLFHAMNMMAPYDLNRPWSDRFLPEIRHIVGSYLLQVAADSYDWHQATDLMLLDARDARVAARVRRPGYRSRYPHEFTIRSRVPSGAETELSKIVNGQADLMFYGHANASETGLEAWWLIDLRAFRAALIRQAQNGHRIRSGDKRNADGTCFKWFDMRSFPSEPPLVLASG